MNTRIAMLAAALSAVSMTGIARADDAEGVLVQNGCTSCHGPGKPMVAPSFDKIAAYYKAQPEARTVLEHSIRAGSRAKWGAMVMRPNDKLSEADARLAADWILAH